MSLGLLAAIRRFLGEGNAPRSRLSRNERVQYIPAEHEGRSRYLEELNHGAGYLYSVLGEVEFGAWGRRTEFPNE